MTQEFVQKPYGLNIFPIRTEHHVSTAFNVSLEDDVISVVTIKKADNREAIIFRLLNNTERQIETALNVNGARLQLTFNKYEVKTVLYE